MAEIAVFSNGPSHEPLNRPVAGPWPVYSSFRALPEQERWGIYELAKAGRRALEDQGLLMSESYDQFVKRVIDELEI